MNKKGKSDESNCIKNNCGHLCCDPVKVLANADLDDDARARFKYKGRFARKSCPDGFKLDMYECEIYDREKRKCLDYDGRPNICKKTVCSHYDNSDELKIKEEVEKKENEEFIKLK